MGLSLYSFFKYIRFLNNGRFAFCLFQKKNKTSKEHKRQSAVFKQISENTNVQWEDPSHRLSVIAGSQAAHRLSTFKTPPNDEDDLNQYIEDQKKVSIAVDVLKENKTGNMGQYKQAVQSIDENIDLILEEQSKQSDESDGSPLFKLIINDGD